MLPARSAYPILTLLAALPAWAEVSSPQGVRLSFVRAENASDCISAAALEHEITRRMGRDPFVGPTQQWIEGMVAVEAGYYEVRLFERDAGGRTVGTRRLREVVGDCRKLEDAIELAIALIIDPTVQLAPIGPKTAPVPRSSASLAQPSNAVPAAAPTPAVTARTSAVDAPTDATVVARAVGRATTSAILPIQRDATNQAEPVITSGAAFVTANAIALWGVLPGVAPGVGVSTRLPLERTKRLALRIASLYMPEKSHNNHGEFGFGLTAFEAGACANGSGRRITWFGCGSLSLGAIHAVVHTPAPLEPGDRLWIALRLEAGLGWQIAGPVWLEARAFDLIAPRLWNFRTRTDGIPETVFVQSRLMPGAAVGLGLKFD